MCLLSVQAAMLLRGAKARSSEPSCLREAARCLAVISTCAVYMASQACMDMHGCIMHQSHRTWTLSTPSSSSDSTLCAAMRSDVSWRLA